MWEKCTSKRVTETLASHVVSEYCSIHANGRWFPKMGFDVLLSRITHGTASTYTSSRASSCYSRDKVSHRPPAYMPLISDIAFLCTKCTKCITGREERIVVPASVSQLYYQPNLLCLAEVSSGKDSRFLRAQDQAISLFSWLHILVRFLRFTPKWQSKYASIKTPAFSPRMAEKPCLDQAFPAWLGCKTNVLHLDLCISRCAHSTTWCCRVAAQAFFPRASVSCSFRCDQLVHQDLVVFVNSLWRATPVVIMIILPSTMLVSR